MYRYSKRGGDLRVAWIRSGTIGTLYSATTNLVGREGGRKRATSCPELYVPTLPKIKDDSRGGRYAAKE